MSYTETGDWVDDGSAYVHVAEWCPGCPDAPPEPWVMRYCGAHQPGTEGTADHVLEPGPWLSGTSEASGDESRAFAELLRGRPGAA